MKAQTHFFHALGLMAFNFITLPFLEVKSWSQGVCLLPLCVRFLPSGTVMS